MPMTGRAVAADASDRDIAGADVARDALRRTSRAMPQPADAPLLGDLLTRVRIVADQAREAAAWPRSERQAVLDALRVVIDTATLARSRVLLAQRDDTVLAGTGQRSFAAAEGVRSGLGEKAVASQERLAAGLATVPVVAEAVSAGTLSMEHAASVARIATSGSQSRRDAVAQVLADPAAQRELVELAARTDAAQFAKAATRWAAELDPQLLEREHAQIRARRHLYLVDADGGLHVRGFFDPVAGHTLRLALEAATPRPAKDDGRTPAQRWADALTALAERTMRLTDPKPGAHVPPQVSFLLSADTWTAIRSLHASAPAGPPTVASAPRPTSTPPASMPLRSAAPTGSTSPRRAPATQDPVGAPSPGGSTPRAVAPAVLEDGTPVPASVIARALCDCELTRIVLDSPSVPVDLGRSVRTFSGPQRRAVIARDRGCGWPGCDRPARWCEVHHMDWWHRDGGRTAVERGVLLCAFHHARVHELDLSIARVQDAAGPDGRALYRFRRPDGRLLAAPPDACGAPHTPHTPDASDTSDTSDTLGASHTLGTPGTPGTPGTEVRTSHAPGAPPGVSPAATRRPGC